MDFPARRKASAGKPIFFKFYVYFPTRMRDTCVSVASVLPGMWATPRDGAWKLRIRYRQHTITARYGRVENVVNAFELRTKCEGAWTYRNEHFSQYWETIYQYWEIKMISRYCKILYGFILMSEIIYRYCKLLSDIGNYFPKSWNTVDMSFWRPWLLYWHDLTLIPAWIINQLPDKMVDEIAYTFPNSKGKYIMDVITHPGRKWDNQC